MKRFFRLFLPCLFTLHIASAQEWVYPHMDSIPQSLTLFFFGDVMQHEPQINRARNHETGDYDYKSCFRYMIPYWRNCDYVIANLETTLDSANFSGYPQFCAPWQLARDLQLCGVDILTTSNNHSCDKGAQGIRNTIRVLDSLEIPHTGTFIDSLTWQSSVPLYIRHEGFKIALLNYTYGTNGIPVPKGLVVSTIDSTVMAKDIAKARQDSASNIVVLVHWGEEYMTSPTPRQKRLARWLQAQGVDIVIGSHPHVVQPVEYVVNGKDTTGVIVYSLGNFVSNQRQRYTNGGIGIRLTLKRDKGRTIGYRMEYLSSHVYRPVENGFRPYYVMPEPLMTQCPKLQRDSLAMQCFKDIDSIIGGAIPKVKGF